MIKNQYGELVRDTVANFTNFKDGDYQSVITEGDEWKKDSLTLGSGQMYSSAAGIQLQEFPIIVGFTRWKLEGSRLLVRPGTRSIWMRDFLPMTLVSDVQ